MQILSNDQGPLMLIANTHKPRCLLPRELKPNATHYEFISLANPAVYLSINTVAQKININTHAQKQK